MWSLGKEIKVLLEGNGSPLMQISNIDRELTRQCIKTSKRYENRYEEHHYKSQFVQTREDMNMSLMEELHDDSHYKTISKYVTKEIAQHLVTYPINKVRRRKMTAKYDAWKEELETQERDCRCSERTKISTDCLSEGDVTMTMGSPERQDCVRRYYVPNASLEDIQDTIQKMNEPCWTHPNLKDCSTEKEKDAIPFEEKRWSIVYGFDIEPMTKELQDAYVEGAKDGFFKKYRAMYGTSKEMLPHDEIEKNLKDDFEEDAFVIEYSESVNKKSKKTTLIHRKSRVQKVF